MCSDECVTTGKYTTPSAITLPAADDAARIQRRHDYSVDDQRRGLPVRRLRKAVRVAWTASWDNNFRPGFFPGSGTQDGYQIAGPLRDGATACFGVQFVVRVQAGSTEYANAHRQTTGYGDD